MYYTSSLWSHVGTFSEKGWVIDATTRGVTEHPFSDYLDGRSFIAILTFKKPLSDEEIAKVLKWSRGTRGAGFDWFGIIRFFWVIILGAHESYRVRFSADFLIVALLLSLLSFWSPMVGIAIGGLSTIYVFTVIANGPRRRAMRRMIRKRPETKEENMIEALWTVEFVSTEGNIGAGVAIFESNRIFGGDVSYYYLGSYDIKDDKINAKVKVTHYFGNPLSIFGQLKEFTIRFSGKIEVPVMTASGYLEENPNQKIVIRCTRRANLP